MRCKKCGEELPEQARFCFTCGEPVDEVPAPRRLEEPLDPMAAGAVPLVPIAPPPRATWVDSRTPRPLQERRPAHPGSALPTPGLRRHVPDELAGAEPGERHSAEGRRADEGRPGSDAEAARAAGDRPDGTPRTRRGRPASRGVRALLSRPVAGRLPLGGVVAAVAALAVVVAAVTVVTTSWLGPLAPQEGEAPQVEPPSDGSIAPIGDEGDGTQDEQAQDPDGGPAVRDAVGDYSWEELSQVSALIAAASSDEEGLRIAEQYNLCGPGGALDGTQTKDVELSDGTVVPVAVAGFRQDERSDGSGVAGITFVARAPMGSVAYCSEGPVSWEDSPIRSWVNQSLMAELPSELADVIVPVEKLTNAPSDSGEGQVRTSDSLWLLSYSEMSGVALSETMPAEGAQYQLFQQAGLDGTTSDFLVVSDDFWWQRSPATDPQWQMTVTPEGDPRYARNPVYEFGVVPGFCL